MRETWIELPRQHLRSKSSHLTTEVIRNCMFFVYGNQEKEGLEAIELYHHRHGLLHPTICQNDVLAYEVGFMGWSSLAGHLSRARPWDQAVSR